MKKRIVCILLALALCHYGELPVSAAREEELQAEKEENTRKLTDINEKVNDLEYQKQQMLSDIDTLDKKLVSVLAQIELLDEQITGKKNEITETDAKLGEAETAKEKQYEAMKKRIQYIYENGGSAVWALSLLEAEDLSDFLNKAEYTEKLYDYDRKSLEEYAETISQVRELSENLTAEKAELEEMKNEQELQRASMEASLEEKKEAAYDYEKQIEEVQAQAAQYKALIEEQNQELKRLEEARKKEEEKQAKEAAKKQNEKNSEDETRNDQSKDNSDRKTEDSSAASGSSTGGTDDGTEADGDSTGNEDNAGRIDTGMSDSSTTPDTDDSSETEGSTQAGGNTQVGGSTQNGGVSGQDVVNYALQFVGNKYVWGGESLTNGVDCSGFTMKVYEHFGFSLPHYTGDQEQCGRGVSYSEAQPGDLILYSGHVAIYMGGGQIVHAANSSPYPKGGIKVSDNAAYMPIVAVRRLIG